MWGYFFRQGKMVGRVTSKDMHAGKAGWKCHSVDFEKAKACALVWFTFKKDRPYGHIGLLLFKTLEEYNEMAHASFSKNKFMRSAVEKGNDFYEHMVDVKEADF